MAHWDVSRELRGAHGRWTKSAALERVSGAAGEAARLQDVRINDHAALTTHLRSLPEGERHRVNGVLVGRNKRGVWAIHGGKGKTYKHESAAAQSILEGAHVSDAPTGPQQAPGPPRVPEVPEVPERAPERPLERVFREGVTSTAERQVHQPKSLYIDKSAYNAYSGNPEFGRKRMRMQAFRATTIQAQHTPLLVDKTSITITKNPIRGSRSGSTLATHSGSTHEIRIRPDVMLGDNTESVKNANVGGWWIPVDNHHSLSDVVFIHEFGHGVHAQLIQSGDLSVNKFGGHIKADERQTEQEFWEGLAAAMGEGPGATITKPEIKPDKFGYESMDVSKWYRDNRTNIAKRVSQYAGSGSINEMMAELWAEYVLSSNPRPAAKYYGDWATDRIGGK